VQVGKGKVGSGRVRGGCAWAGVSVAADMDRLDAGLNSCGTSGVLSPAGQKLRSRLSDAMGTPTAECAEGRADETTSVIEELSALYQSGDDAAKVVAVNETMAEARRIVMEREGCVKEMVRSLQERVAAAEMRAVNPETPGHHTRRAAAVLADRTQAESSIANLKTEQVGLEKQLGEVRTEREILDMRRAELDRTLAMDLPRKKSEVSLYAHICGIRWDDKTFGGKRKLQGIMCLPQDVRSFDIDTALTTDLGVANRLWALMDTE